MTEKLAENIYTFPITLPNNPLKWLNSYAIKKTGEGRNLLIDTGFNRPECSEELLAGMRELNLQPEETDVFLTHFHADHSGNAALLQSLGCRILMGSIDYAHLQRYTKKDYREQMAREGMPPEVLEEAFGSAPSSIYASAPFTAETVEDGAELCYGGYRLRCILTPGHTPGHICLYDRKYRLFFSGDHVLFDISPNICANGSVPDILSVYIDSLRRVKNLGVDLCLPAHRTTGNQTLCERVDALIAHHAARLAEAERIVRTDPGLTTYDITGKMHWRIRAKGWDEFPAGQRIFAIGEARAHLDALRAQERISCVTDERGVSRWY